MAARLVVPIVGDRPRYEATIVIVPRTLRSPEKSKRIKPWPEFGGHQWWNECGRKEAYYLKAEADRVLLIMGFRPKRDPKTKRLRKLKVYQCPWCEWWHLGHEILR